MRKYIFSDKTEVDFVIFEGRDKCFWANNRNGNVRYCHVNLDYKKAILFHKQGTLSCKEVKSNEEEYKNYIEMADLDQNNSTNEWLNYFGFLN